MRNTLQFSICLVVALVLTAQFASAQPADATIETSPKYLARQWLTLPADIRRQNLEDLVSQYQALAFCKTGGSRQSQTAALLKVADELRADPTNDSLVDRFFALYAEAKSIAPKEAPEVPEAMPAPVTEGMNGEATYAATIRPKDLQYWTGTIHSSWFDGFVKSDGEIWAGENIVATHFRGWIVFDLSPIPSNAMITAVTLKVYTSVSSNSPTHELSVCAPMNDCDPRTWNGSNLYYSLLSSTWFRYATNAMVVTGQHSLSLTSAANNDLQKRLGHYNWWAVGIVEDGDNDDWGVFAGHDVAQFPTCDVAYNVPTDEVGSRTVAPTSFELCQNYPNPFNPTTTIRYVLPCRSSVHLAVYNALGDKVAELVNREMEPGSHEVQFDGAKFASGVYFYRVQAGGFVQSRKLILQK